ASATSPCWKGAKRLPSTASARGRTRRATKRGRSGRGSAASAASPTPSCRADDGVHGSDPDARSVPAAQGRASRNDPFFPDGGFLRDVWRGRARRLASPRNRAHEPRQEEG